ncbi:MAG TPA: bifunctional adenosylcobinamide kinase/adenosylcobinamide-phosphate guanylyltransferase [Candidatus Binatia bacterium]|nr:bifunctional adenosylcobinamide kinase/adenosylcobinamide-phosphate guanylyltransferase [Candidatus Binatia bacterium]
MLAPHSSHLILGGARSGKSRRAQELAHRWERVAVVATAEALDDDMAARIARHRAERPSGWVTVESPLDPVGACRLLAGSVDVAVVDCLTLWVSNRLLRGDDAEAILGGAAALAALCRERALSLVIVSNEVGEGVHPETREGLRFRDLLGLVNQRVAEAADRVTLMVAGIPLAVKDDMPGLRLAPDAGATA